MMLNEKVFRKLVRRIAEMVGVDLAYEDYKAFCRNELTPTNMQHFTVNRIINTLHYINNNLQVDFSREFIKTIYYLLAQIVLTNDVVEKIYSEYYMSIDANIYDRVAQMIITIGSKFNYNMELSFMIGSYMLQKNKLYPLIIDELFQNDYLHLVENGDYQPLSELLLKCQLYIKGMYHYASHEKIKLENILTFFKLNKVHIIEKYQVNSLQIFGSTTNDTETEVSDVDLIVSFCGKLLNFEIQKISDELKVYITNELRMPVDLIEFRHAIKYIRPNGLQQLIRII